MNMIDNSRMIYLDGAMGTMLQRSGLKMGEKPEVFGMLHPDVVKEIHLKYIRSGSDVIYANTFGANSHKYEGSGYDVEEVILANVRTARAVLHTFACRILFNAHPVNYTILLALSYIRW